MPPPKYGGSKIQNNKPQTILEHPKLPFTFFVVIIAEILFVELKVALL
jgi:hypothetical protein